MYPLTEEVRNNILGQLKKKGEVTYMGKRVIVLFSSWYDRVDEENFNSKPSLKENSEKYREENNIIFITTGEFIVFN